ncbi:MAG: CPBP family intramembrane metalloprotease [Lachnospiraceae bacterium]|nr:CPBP family intramembrane metalloprotease [Lachnospiraceae bacterium]
MTFSCLFLQQITTGFWEELTFRAFLIEGYWKRKNQNWNWRLFYATLSFIIFGMIHAIEYTDNIGDAIDVFISTGVMGFTFAAIYLYSHNILVPMLLHFVYDIFANMQSFIKEWNIDNTLFLIFNNYILIIAFIVMFASAVFLL